MGEEIQENESKGIKIGEKYILRSDSLNLILEEYGYKNPSPKDAKKAKEEGITLEPSWGLVRTTYHRTLKQVLNQILDNNIINSDIKELQDIVQVVEKLRNEFNAFKNVVKVDEDTLEVISD